MSGVRSRVTASPLAPAALLLLLLTGGTPARAQDTGPLLIDSTAQTPPVVVRVVPDDAGSADSLTVGHPFWTTVRTSGPPGYSLLPASILDAYRARPEVAVLDTDRRDGQLRIQLALFRPGDVILPAVTARVLTGRGDTVAVPVLSDTIRIASVLAPGDTLLADIKPPWTEAGLPAWAWWAIGLAALLVALGLWWLVRRRRRPVSERETGAHDPYAAARASLEALRAETPTAAGRALAAARVGEALRGYLADGWDLGARERTTLELLAGLPAELAADRPALGAALTSTDLAKFARLAPAPGELPLLVERALDVLDRLEARRRPAAEPELEARPPERDVAS